MRQPSEQSACPRNGITQAGGASLYGCQVEKTSEDIWNTEQRDHDWVSRRSTGVACQPLLPGQPPMRPLRAGQRRRRGGWGGSASWRHLNLHPLAAYQLQAGSPLSATAPVPPEHGSRGDG
jgi:hypothetical protein